MGKNVENKKLRVQAVLPEPRASKAGTARSVSDQDKAEVWALSGQIVLHG